MADALTGTLLAGRYRVGPLLGRGGVGAVYQAQHLASGRTLAVKRILPDAPEELARRLEREAKAQSLLDHPNIVEVLDLVSTESGLFLVMELVHGTALGDLVAAGPLPPRRALVLARQVLDALEHAHALGVVHRDLKPDNIMVVRAGEPGLEYDQVKLLDFGLVKLIGDAAQGDEQLTRTGTVFGTPAYMAPEQALGRAVDGRADLYALGCVLFEMLTGAPPFVSGDAMALLRLHVAQPPPSLPAAPHATAELQLLVARALVKSVEHRWPSAAAMRTALDAAFLSIQHVA